MKYFYIIANADKRNSKEMAVQIQDYLQSNGCVCYIEEKKAVQPSGYKYTDADNIPQEVQCVITLGGDGTLIQAARDLAGRALPLVGVNMGHLGYLAQISREEELCDRLRELVENRFSLEQRMMVSGRVYHQGRENGNDIALNDIVITRRDLFRVLNFRIFVNCEFLYEYKADGMIIATPTGSTAYNLSAGGPIVSPGAQMMILTPICPHTLNSRSVVIPSDDSVKIEILGNDDNGQVAVFDGDHSVEMQVGDSIIIEKAQIQTTLVKLKNISFLDNLREKMAGI